MHTTKATVTTTSLGLLYPDHMDSKNLGVLEAAILRTLRIQDPAIAKVRVKIVAEGKAVEIKVTAPQPVSAAHIKRWL
jgi:ribosomal protein L28